MDVLLSNIRIEINDNLFLKNPESSDLGKKIVNGSIDLINEKGFDCFTFAKLGKEIGSTEASIYRYFDSKHKLLVYITSLYWGWLEYKLMFRLANITDKEDKINRAIAVITNYKNNDGFQAPFNEEKLNKIVISESSKAYLTKEVDEENKQGFFAGYKQLVAHISELIIDYSPNYKYPQMLISTVIEGAHHQHYFAQHLPSLTNTCEGENTIFEFYKSLIYKALNA
jgi:AcrR family transcriptional regulator